MIVNATYIIIIVDQEISLPVYITIKLHAKFVSSSPLLLHVLILYVCDWMKRGLIATYVYTHIQNQNIFYPRAFMKAK